MGRGAERERLDESFDATGAAREIRALNESFNQLMAALSGKRVELERRGSELAAATEVLTDEVRERERVERALRDSEAQLRQSQKMGASCISSRGIDQLPAAQIKSCSRCATRESGCRRKCGTGSSSPSSPRKKLGRVRALVWRRSTESWRSPVGPSRWTARQDAARRSPWRCLRSRKA